MRNRLAFLETSASGSGLDAVRKARDLGHEVVFCTDHRAYFDKLPGASVLNTVDVVEVDCYDPDAVTAVLEATGRIPDGVLAMDDYHLLPAAHVARHFSLPGHDPIGLEVARRKDLMRQVLEKASVPQPAFWVIDDVQQCDVDMADGRLVIKPVDDSGSVAVAVVEDLAGAKKAVGHVLDRTTNVRGYQLTPLCLVEGYIEGPEYSAELLHIGKVWVLIGYTTKDISSGGSAIEIGHAFPASLGVSHVAISAQIINWLNAVGLDWGAAHVEFKLDGTVAVPVEINPRLPGNQITQLIEDATGVDPIRSLIELALGIEPALPATEITRAAAIAFLLPPHAGLVDDVLGWDRARDVDGVTAARPAGTFPRSCGVAASNYDHLAFVTASGTNAPDAAARAVAGLSALEVRYGHG